jgi:hypothetical protein
MAILDGDKVETIPAIKPVMPIVASKKVKYGLRIGPKGNSFGGAQHKPPTWAYLFTKDESGAPNLMNVVEYLEANSNDFVTIEKGIDDFVAAYLIYKNQRQAA